MKHGLHVPCMYIFIFKNPEKNTYFPTNNNYLNKSIPFDKMRNRIHENYIN